MQQGMMLRMVQFNAPPGSKELISILTVSLAIITAHKFWGL
jgi:hypothetical protein